MDIYAQDQIISANVIEATVEDVTLAVQAMSETAYYLAGATLQDEDTRRAISLVRCRVGKTCPVDFAATKIPGTPGPASIKVTGSDTPIDLIYKDGSRATLYTPDR